MTAPVPAGPATAVLPRRSAPARRARDEGLTVAELLDLLEEPRADRPAPAPIAARLLSLGTAARPHVAADARRLATAVSVAALLVVVPLAALLVVTAEKVAGAELPAGARSRADRARSWLGQRGDQLGAWCQWAAQWVLGPHGAWDAHGRQASSTGRVSGGRAAGAA